MDLGSSRLPAAVSAEDLDLRLAPLRFLAALTVCAGAIWAASAGTPSTRSPESWRLSDPWLSARRQGSHVRGGVNAS